MADRRPEVGTETRGKFLKAAKDIILMIKVRHRSHYECALRAKSLRVVIEGASGRPLTNQRTQSGPHLGRLRVRNVQKSSETTNNPTATYHLVNGGFRLDLPGRRLALKCPVPAFQAGNAGSNPVGTANQE